MIKQAAIIVLLLSFTISNAQKVIPLYNGKAPGSESWNWKEEVLTVAPSLDRVIYNVSEPTITAYLPEASKANGTSVIVAPGGAFHVLSIDNEGVAVAKWLNSKGIAAFVLKYRVVKTQTDNPLKELSEKMKDIPSFDKENETVVLMGVQDGLTAVKYVRSHANELNVNPGRIGFMGFSAGGTLTMSVAYNATEENRPNFVAPIYPYGGAIIGNKIPKEKTPIFIAVASDDGLGFLPHSIAIYNRWHDAKQPAELHIYERGGHGFGMKKNKITTDKWTNQFIDWLKMQGF
nr:alpha/beta hydrolase [uncultured Flavobacterium sp.]